MGTVNRVILVGNLGRDAELRYTGGGAAVASFSVATTEVWKDKDGQKQEQTEWHRISLWGKQGETVAQYLTKGKQVYVEGRLQTRKWQDKEGNDKYTTEIVADRMQMLGSRQGMGGGGAEREAGGEREPAGGGGARPAPKAGAKPAGGKFDDFEDDIPF